MHNLCITPSFLFDVVWYNALMNNDLLTSTKKGMDEVISRLKDELATVQTGRASAALVDGIIVQYYGNNTPLKQMASILIPESNVIVIQPWDRQAVNDVEQAIRQSDMNLSTINEGTHIRIVLPALTTDRRTELVKMVHSKAESARVALRNLRKDTWDQVQKQEKAGELTEDDRYRYEGDLNKIIDKFNQEVEELTKTKEKDLQL